MKSGDKVKWTETTWRGKSFSMRLKHGVIDSISNGVALVKTGRGRFAQVPVAKLQKEGQKSQITEFVELMRESSRGK